MLVNWQDFNGAQDVLAGPCEVLWDELHLTLTEMPLHLKSSDQAGMQGSLIFDPVGTNNYIKDKLQALGWTPNVPIPEAYKFLGLDVDFVKRQVLAEVQFSNYPFLNNNILRSELLYKSRTMLNGYAPDILILVSKGGMFPSSNSTLYFEQAVNQTAALANNNVFDIPMRVVGLREEMDTVVASCFTRYHQPRYSRTVVERVYQRCRVASRPRSLGCTLTLIGS